MTTVGLKPSLYLLRLVEANIVHHVNLNANRCQKEPITNTQNIALDKETQPIVTILNDPTQEPIDLIYFEDIEFKIHFTILSSTIPNHDGSYNQELITSTSFLFCPAPAFPVETPSCCTWPPNMKYEQMHGLDIFPPTTPWIKTKLHTIITPALPQSLKSLTIPIQAELLRWSSDGNSTSMKNRFYPSINGRTQLREPSEYLYGMSENLSSFKLSNVPQLDEAPIQFRQQPQVVRNPHRRPFQYNQTTRTPSHEIAVHEAIEKRTPEQSMHISAVRKDLHPDNKVNVSVPEYHIDDDIYHNRSNVSLVNVANTSTDRPALGNLQSADKNNGSVEEQFQDEPSSSSEKEPGAGQSHENTTDLTARPTSSLPVVQIETNPTISTRGQKLAENLPTDEEKVEFLTQLKQLVDDFPRKIPSLFLEPVLTLNPETGAYDLDLTACTDALYRQITYLMEQNEEHNVLRMDIESFESFYTAKMKKYRPSKKKPPAKTATAAKKSQASGAESGEDTVDPDQTPKDKVVETNDQDK